MAAQRSLFVALTIGLGLFPIGGTAGAEGLAGAYLAGRQAVSQRDYKEAADYFTRALTRDMGNPELMESAVLAHLSLGQVDRALPIARKLESDGQRSQAGQMVLVLGDITDENFASLLTRVEERRAIGPLVDGLLVAWAHLGKGDVTAALGAFDTLSKERGLEGFAFYHKALALASVGDFEGAEAIFAAERGGALQMTRRSVIARLQILSQMGRNDAALALLDDLFGPDLDPALRGMRETLAKGETLSYDIARSPREGLAEVMFTVAGALMNEANDDFTLLYTRMAAYLRPDHTDAILMTARMLENMDRYDLAVDVYAAVPRDDPAFHAAELGRAEALRRTDRTDAAAEVLAQLAQTHGDLPAVHVALGDLRRQLKDWPKAVDAYSHALDIHQPDDTDQWFILYARAISYERQGLWAEAEADFRRALDLNPEQPQVLNYLGYSLVEQKIKLDEALSMIERAVAAQPDSGYIVDSLGWVLYRLGRYDEAVQHMERAAELMPVDPVVNDHLGDVYWAVGRTREAQFQWKRALSFVDGAETADDVDPDRIRRKLEVGLDQVLADEGAPPLKVANDN